MLPLWSALAHSARHFPYFYDALLITLFPGNSLLKLPKHTPIIYNEISRLLSGVGYTADKSDPSLCECSYNFVEEGGVNQGLD